MSFNRLTAVDDTFGVGGLTRAGQQNATHEELQ